MPNFKEEIERLLTNRRAEETRREAEKLEAERVRVREREEKRAEEERRRRELSDQIDHELIKAKLKEVALALNSSTSKRWEFVQIDYDKHFTTGGYYRVEFDQAQGPWIPEEHHHVSYYGYGIVRKEFDAFDIASMQAPWSYNNPIRKNETEDIRRNRLRRDHDLVTADFLMIFAGIANGKRVIFLSRCGNDESGNIDPTRSHFSDTYKPRMPGNSYPLDNIDVSLLKCVQELPELNGLR